MAEIWSGGLSSSLGAAKRFKEADRIPTGHIVSHARSGVLSLRVGRETGLCHWDSRCCSGSVESSLRSADCANAACTGPGDAFGRRRSRLDAADWMRREASPVAGRGAPAGSRSRAAARWCGGSRRPAALPPPPCSAAGCRPGCRSPVPPAKSGPCIPRAAFRGNSSGETGLRGGLLLPIITQILNLASEGPATSSSLGENPQQAAGGASCVGRPAQASWKSINGAACRRRGSGRPAAGWLDRPLQT